jgi:hypothetical protein
VRHHQHIINLLLDVVGFALHLLGSAIPGIVPMFLVVIAVYVWFITTTTSASASSSAALTRSFSPEVSFL